MNYKRILLSVSMIAFVGALVVGATGAFFSDTETSTGNTFTAGAIDLTIDNDSYLVQDGEISFREDLSWSPSNLDDGEGPSGDGQYLFFNYQDLKPGDLGEDTISIHVDNNDAWACADLEVTKNDDVSTTEPESQVDDDENPEDDFDGELAQNLQLFLWADDGDNVYENNETPLIEGEGNTVTFDRFIDGISYPIADSQVSQLTENKEGPLTGGKTYYIGKAWCFGDITPEPVDDSSDEDPQERGETGFSCSGSQLGNDTQTDMVEGTVSFRAVQSRNNSDFTCEFPQDNGDREIIGTTGQSWPSADELVWQAEGRYGDNGTPGNQDWEIGVGNNTQNSNSSDNTHSTWADGSTQNFTVEYTGGGTATLTVGGVSEDYNVGSISSTADLYVVAGRASSGSGDSVEVENLMLNSTPVSPSSVVASAGNVNHLGITSEDLSGGFTLTGTVTFNYTSGSTSGSAPAFQVQVRD